MRLLRKTNAIAYQAAAHACHHACHRRQFERQRQRCHGWGDTAGSRPLTKASGVLIGQCPSRSGASVPRTRQAPFDSSMPTTTPSISSAIWMVAVWIIVQHGKPLRRPFAPIKGANRINAGSTSWDGCVRPPGRSPDPPAKPGGHEWPRALQPSWRGTWSPRDEDAALDPAERIRHRL